MSTHIIRALRFTLLGLAAVVVLFAVMTIYP